MTFIAECQKLTPKQLNALPLLAGGASSKDVAGAVKVNPATVSQWVNHNENFRAALKTLSAKNLSIAETQLQSLAIDAISELRRLLSGAKSEQVRLKAIEVVLISVGLSGLRKGERSGGDEEQFVTNAERYDFNKLVESLTGG